MGLKKGFKEVVQKVARILAEENAAALVRALPPGLAARDRVERNEPEPGDPPAPSFTRELIPNDAKSAAGGGGATCLQLDYPTSARNSPRWIQHVSTHAGIRALITKNEPEQFALLERISKLPRRVFDIAESQPDGDARPRWANSMLAGLDACALGALLATNPKRYLEIGSGNSTKFARHFIDKLGLQTRITSIDPMPRAECDGLCDEIIREPFELCPIDAIANLEAGDLLFFDGSHRCFMNSDVTAVLLDLIPALAPGVLIGVHDIYWPDDYPAEWADRYYSEQYILGAFLLGADRRVQVVFPSYFNSVYRADTEQFLRAKEQSGCPAELFHGCAFWFRIDS